MLGFQESFSLGAILAGVMLGCLGNQSDRSIQSAWTEFIKHQGKFVNHDLEKALRSSFVLAQYSIASELRQELVGSSRMVRQGSSRIGRLEYEPEIRWLGKKLKQLKGELNFVKQLTTHSSKIQSLHEIGLLLTTDDTFEQKIEYIRESLALVIDVMPLANQERSIRLQVHPTGAQNYLPPILKTLVLDTSGKIFQEVQAKNDSKWIQLNISGKTGEQFIVKIQLGDVSMTKNIVI